MGAFLSSRFLCSPFELFVFLFEFSLLGLPLCLFRLLMVGRLSWCLALVACMPGSYNGAIAMSSRELVRSAGIIVMIIVGTVTPQTIMEHFIASSSHLHLTITVANFL